MAKRMTHKRHGIRAAALTLALTVSVSLLGVLEPEASAVTSLSGIEHIRARGSLSILEIVPRSGTGSIGYYVDQQEPVADWLDVLAATSGAAARQAYADGLLADLKTVGLMGETGDSDADYPLLEIGPYREYDPWEHLPEDASALTLDRAEEHILSGSFHEDEDGDYVQANAYVFDTAGEYVENAQYHVFGQKVGESAGEETYYYNVNFTRVHLTEENVETYLGTPLYTPVTDLGVPYYEYAGTLQRGGRFTIDDDTNDGVGYFTAQVVPGLPVTAWESLEEISVTTETISSLVGQTLYVTAEEGYAPVEITADFVPAEGTVYYRPVENAHSYFASVDPDRPYRLRESGETGAFRQITGYRYVGTGNTGGETAYSLTLGGAGAENQTVLNGTVFIAGGFSNSHWFKRYVLDMDGKSAEELAAFRIAVNSVTPDMLTEAMIRSAGLVVVSAGFDRAGAVVPYAADVNAALLPLLEAKPRVVDTRITGAAGLLGLRDGLSSPAVTAANVYNFAPGTGGDHREALATRLFHTPFADQTSYAPVRAEIDYENFLRQDDVDNLLSTDISMAACIRYIINTHRTVNKKTALHVLDIQPVARYDGEDGPLDIETVLSWLPLETRNQLEVPGTEDKYNIRITHMSTAALVGKIEDISEQYDLIYIGADDSYLDAMNLPDGMYYSNIGDTASVNTSKLSGLLSTGNNRARYSGNDLTPRKKTELLEFAAAGLPMVVSDKLTAGSGAREAGTLSVTLTENGSRLTAVPALTTTVPGVQYSYQWYRNGSAISGGTDATISAGAGHSYRCAVTAYIDSVGYTAYSETKHLTASGWTFEPAEGSWGSWHNDSRYFSGNGPATNRAEQKLTVSYTDRSGLYETARYQWYRGADAPVAISGANSAAFTVPAYDEYYYCRITITYAYGYGNRTTYCTSPAVKMVLDGAAFTTTAPAVDTEIPAASGGVYTIDPARVDPCSLLHEVLESVWTRENVMVQSTLEPDGGNPHLDDNQDTLVRYLNLSRPSITLTEQPKSYGGLKSAGGSTVDLTVYDCAGNLDFTFSIQNPTDPEPVLTRYECRLYIDQNGDGRHTEEERISDLYLGEVTGGSTAQVTENGTLRADATYTLQRSLNRTQFSGIVAWKLQVVKVGESAVHASEKGYAYIHPASPTAIRVLQIRPHNGSGIDLKTNTNFTGLYQELKDANAYEVTVDTTTVNTLNRASSAAAVFAQMDLYDMIILGFEDMYGELNANVAQAVVDYIETGKAVLFTHDTTSFCNVASNAQWGYYFNQVIRDKVGLDRYGVTSNNYRATVSAGADGRIGAAGAAQLQSAGYTVGYVPGSGHTSAAETQGYTNLTVDRYPNSGGDQGTTKTTSVSQTNQGQITEYPYRIGDLSVATTHEQYYQLNMNADDIVVWYCLSGSGYANYRSDATNAYYIYNRGNITYSGAGHNTNLTSDEAQLFVNTMIAAYRAVNNPPFVEFRTANDYPAATQLVPVEFGSGASSEALGSEQTIFFKIQDTNLTANKSIAMELYYATDDADAVEDFTLTPAGSLEIPRVKQVAQSDLGAIYRADNGAPVSPAALNSGVLYRMTIPDEILEDFAESGHTETSIYIKAVTSIPRGAYVAKYTGSDDLTLKKLGLLRLT